MFTDGQLARMKVVQEDHMMDEVVHMVWSASKDALNADVPTWTDGVTLRCGIDMTGGSEQRDGGRIMVTYDARIRIPLGTVVDMRDRFRVKKRFGATKLNGIVYELVTPPEEGPSGQVLNVRKVDPSE